MSHQLTYAACHTHSSRKRPSVIHLKLFTLHYRERKVLERHIIILTRDADLCASGCQAAVHMFRTGLRSRATLAGVWQETSRLQLNYSGQTSGEVQAVCVCVYARVSHSHHLLYVTPRLHVMKRKVKLRNSEQDVKIIWNTRLKSV